MEKTKRIRRMCAFVCMALALSGCGGSAKTEETESLDIDYVSADGAVTEERVFSENENFIDRLTQKLSSDKDEAGRQTDVPAETEEETESSGLQAAYSEGNSSREEEGTDSEQSREETKEKETSSGKTPSENTKNTSESDKASVTMTIRCDTAVANGMHEEDRWAGIVPANGCILPVTVMELKEGDTVFDLLCRVRDKYKLQMEYSGGDGSEYIEGINNLYEFDGGRWSGWMYCVNDWYPNYGCGQYVVNDGDVIEWNYTCDLGLDLDGAWWEGAEDWKKTHE